MANEQNLIPNSQRTPSEVRENCRKGGIASGKARREKRAFREILEQLLEKQIEDKNTGEMVTRKEAITTMLIANALKGNINAWREIRDSIGEKPIEEHHIIGTVPTEMSIDGILNLRDVIDGKKPTSKQKKDE